MRYGTLNIFSSASSRQALKAGPIAVVLLEDAVEIASTIAHCRKIGFKEIIVVGAEDLLPDDDADLRVIRHDMNGRDALTRVMNSIIKALPGRWLHYCYNAEYLHYPFCETRTIQEMVTFNSEERRNTVMTYVVDLYSNDLGSHPNAVSLETAHMDGAGYYALVRHGKGGQALDRQMDFFGGLRWRYEEHIPWGRRRIDRVGLFKSAKGLMLNENHTFNMAEYNTFACPWHNNITAAICSFRTAKALTTNPGSVHDIQHFWWKHSVPFEWNSNQLLQLGIIEPGQWF